MQQTEDETQTRSKVWEYYSVNKEGSLIIPESHSGDATTPKTQTLLSHCTITHHRVGFPINVDQGSPTRQRSLQLPTGMLSK